MLVALERFGRDVGLGGIQPSLQILGKVLLGGLGVGLVVDRSKNFGEFRLRGFLRLEPTNPTLPYDLAFPEVFFATGDSNERRGFDAVLGNPPWDRIEIEPAVDRAARWRRPTDFPRRWAI